MKELPHEYRQNGFTYTKVLRTGRSCIYAQHVTPKITNYELFIPKIKPAETIMGRHYPEREIPPGNEDFGYSAWTLRTLNEAKAKLKALQKKLTGKSNLDI